MAHLVRVIVVVLALGSAAMAGTISVWKTPDGTVHIGTRPPEGSTLIETYSTGETADEAPATLDEAFARAASDGREIMRRRANEREARRARRSTQEPPVLAPPATGQQTVIVLGDQRSTFSRFPTIVPRPPHRRLPHRSTLPRIAPSPFANTGRISPAVRPPVVNRSERFDPGTF